MVGGSFIESLKIEQRLSYLRKAAQFVVFFTLTFLSFVEILISENDTFYCKCEHYYCAENGYIQYLHVCV